MNGKFRKIKSCRLCESKVLYSLINFGSVPLGNNLQTDPTNSSMVEEYPLNVMRCSCCGHFQLDSAVDPKILYATNYTYLSGIGKSFLKHIKAYVNWVEKKCNLLEGDLVLEIGSNDGSCLEIFKKKKYKVLGVDPATTPSCIAIEKGIPTINKFFDFSVVKEIKKKYGLVDIVTSQNALAHVDDLIKTFSNIYDVLKDEGYLVFEIGYFKNVLETGCFDTIYHEHLDYHHAHPLKKHLNKVGFTLVAIETNDIQGGSLRVLVKKSVKIKQPLIVKKFIENESRSVLFDEIYLKNWKNKIYKDSEKIKKLFSLDNHKLCFAFGAPTKAVLLLKILQLDKDSIDFIVDDNNLKVNKYLPRVNIPIVPFEKIDFNKSATILLLAWNFSDDIIFKLKLKYKVNAKIIIPLPKLRIVNI